MRKLIVLIVLLVLCNVKTFAYQNNVQTRYRNASSFSYGFFTSVRYQKALGNYFSVGLNCRGYMYQFHQGIRFDILTRYYYRGVFEYFYIQPKMSLGKHGITMRYTVDGNSSYINQGIHKDFHELIIGAGVDVGLQIPLRKKQDFFLEINGGYNYYTFPKNIPLQIERGGIDYYAVDKIKVSAPIIGMKDKEVGKTSWLNPSKGPGKVVDFSISIGWVF